MISFKQWRGYFDMRRQNQGRLTNPRDSMVSMSLVIVGQIVMFACVYLLGHWYGAGTLGTFNYWMAIGSFTSSILAFRYELACVDDSPAESFSAFVNASLLAAVVALTSFVVTSLLGRPDLWLIELYSLASFIQMAASLYYNSLRWYGRMALSRIAINAAFVGFLLIDHVFDVSRGSNPFVCYTWITFGVALAMTLSIVRSGHKQGFSSRLSRRFFIDNRSFAIYVLPSTLCNSVVHYSLSIAIPLWFGAENGGYFSAAYRLGFFPVALVGQGLGGVFRRDAVAAVSKNDGGEGLRQVYVTYARTLALFGALYALAASLLFAPLVRLTLGPDWQETIELFNRLIPLFTLQLVFLPLAQVFLAIRSQRTDFLFQLTSCIALLTTLFLTKLAGLPVQQSVQAFSFSGAVLTVLGILLTYRVSFAKRSPLSGSAA
ncbi:hypothetical protein BurMR1_0758 [Burkholderia sp. MR1]|nr:hypothetical protein BurMR1_0758 [Burkholderia sp. MR1]